MNPYQQQINTYIDTHKDAMLALLDRLCRIPSYKLPEKENMPYGENVTAVLREAEKVCTEMGFGYENFENRCVLADLNDKKTVLGILCHLDIVPIEGEWKYPALGATVDGEFAYGRGTCDNKGATVAVLYAMKALKDCGVPMTYNIRALLGGDEECGGTDVRTYHEKCGLPKYNFVPDASFPVAVSERGILRFRAVTPVTGTKVRSLRCGLKANIIPAEAVAEIVGVTEEELRKAGESCPRPYDLAPIEGGFRVTVHGVSGHSSAPSGFKNALTAMVTFLAALEPTAEFWQNLHNAFPHGVFDGSAVLHISNKCTFSFTMLNLENGIADYQADSRIYIGTSAREIMETFKQNFPYSADIQELRVSEPHSVSPDAPIVSVLQSVYKEITDRDEKPYHMNAMTYAHQEPNAVVFGGAIMGDRHGNAHGANECINIETMLTSAKIFADAIIRICGENPELEV